jgi:hypothetical protein
MVVENEPVERQGRGDPGDERLHGRRRGVRRRCRLEHGELVARVEVGQATTPEAFVATGFVRDIEGADRCVAPVERQDLQPRLP